MTHPPIHPSTQPPESAEAPNESTDADEADIAGALLERFDRLEQANNELQHRLDQILTRLAD